MGFYKTLRRALTNTGFFDQAKKYDEDTELMLAQLHPDAHEEGGLACNDKQLLIEMRECIMVWIKSMGRQILQGNLNLVNTSFPVLMFEPRSYLQKLADIWAYPDYINAAAAAQDPLERMKLLVTWMVAGLHHSVENWKKPFNPILGETWQATMPGGLQLFMEQVSHHPPVSAYQLQGPGWALSGWSQPAVVPVVKFYGIKTVAKGARSISFADGSSVEMTMPHFAIKGVVYAAKPHAEVLGVARLLDEQHRLEAVVSFGPVAGTRQRMLARADAVCGEIYQLPRAAHLQENCALSGGALQRSSTAVTALDDMNSDAEQLAALSLDRSCSSSETYHSDTNGPAAAAAAADDDVAFDPDDEAIFNDFEATHLSGNGAAAAAPAASKQAEQQQQQQQPEHAANGSSSRHGYHRSKSSMFDGSSSVPPVSSSSSGRKGAGGPTVPGVAVARIEGCWLSHLNVDNKRYWTLAEATPQHFAPAARPLPSDLSLRPDLKAVAAGDMDAAQRHKEAGEHQQRSDRRLREAAGVFEH
ncbi:hypothetical protein OEZ86_006630 [Tetradesmus obliquus]|uniref:Oxysterol-binding protein n=1 Tax=Tetradesmus obliquus TaxID=3088 RepID=A0A383VDA1_TETOB|nr:hypothetical protein OEZ86_006630 [Tetradesmus obliquus]|eukprot:jgi/Sobl393_1/9943/SZX63547.1